MITAFRVTKTEGVVQIVLFSCLSIKRFHRLLLFCPSSWGCELIREQHNAVVVPITS